MKFVNLKHLIEHHPSRRALDFIKYIGPGLLVAIGFIDPGNWATNVAAGSLYGYSMLWVITLATGMLIILQHNSAHLGIVTGYCLSEAATIQLKPVISKPLLASAVVAAMSTAYAEILGGAIALDMLFKIPIKLGIAMILALLIWLLATNSYKRLEKLIIGFIAFIGVSFLLELLLIHIDWHQTLTSWVTPTFPKGSMLVIMSVLGAVVMPHNMFLHSEIIQSRQWNLTDDSVKVKHLRYEFLDTSFSMLVGWAINSAMIILAAGTFFIHKTAVNDLSQAQQMLRPLLGNTSAVIFASALLFAGISAAITAGLAGGSIFSGIFGENYDVLDYHTKIGIGLTLIPAALVALFTTNLFQGLIYSQMILSIQLPFTIFLQIYMTSSKKLMGKFANGRLDKILLWGTGIVVSVLNLALFYSVLFK